ncbi:uncharacterized protein JCM15063_006172, partial [Sporobolomyces koalae]|uniref:uncharacterized protein n=1 Tax=Sporobolomyces koalae TaxID=500713 RepID=UPI00316D2994
LDTAEQGGLGLTSQHYALVPGDLRELESLKATLLHSPSSSQSNATLLDPSLPTLLLLECVLVYLPPSATSNLLSFFASTFLEGSVVSYDPFGLNDSFGQVMKRNLAMRGLSLPGADSTPDLASLTSRLEANGFEGTTTGAISIKQIRESVLPRDEVDRVNKIEQIDEVEELNLVLDHYAVSWGTVTLGSKPRIALTST